MSTVDVVFVLGQSNGAGLFINGLDRTPVRRSWHMI